MGLKKPTTFLSYKTSEELMTQNFASNQVMKYFMIFLVLIGSSGLIIPQTFGDNEFCNINENLKIQEELIKDDVVLVEFLKVLPHAKLTRANYVDESNPEQTSMSWTEGVYSLDIHIWGFDENNPSDCFFPGGSD